MDIIILKHLWEKKFLYSLWGLEIAEGGPAGGDGGRESPLC